MFPSSSLKELKALGVGMPGALAAAIVGNAEVDMDLDIGLWTLWMVFEEAVEEDKDRKWERDRCWDGRLCCVQPATCMKLCIGAVNTVLYRCANWRCQGSAITYSDILQLVIEQYNSWTCSHRDRSYDQPDGKEEGESAASTKTTVPHEAAAD